MVQTRSAAARHSNSDSAERSPYRFVPRQHVEVHSTGITMVDHYLQQDCVLTPEELKRLAAHKYSAIDISWLDELCMKSFWERVVKFCPLWVAPNLITLIGLIVNLITVLVLSHYSPSAKEDAPRWAYLLAALGELFDHGCDSVSQIFVSLNVCYALQLGQVQYGVFFVCILSIVVFYTAHWSTYCTGQLRFARFDVTEAQMVVIGMLVATSIFGPGLWSIGIFGFHLKHLMIISTFIGAIYQMSAYLFTIMTGGIGRNGSTVAGTSVLFPICPLLAVVVPFCMMYSKSGSDVFERNITVFALFFGAVAAKATNRLIVAHMSRSELTLWDWTYLGPTLMILNQYYDYVFSEQKLLYICAIYSICSLILYCVMVTRQIYTFGTMGDHYGFSLTTFSPSGKLMQIEYALNAVKNGQPSVGLRASDGVVLATENHSPILFEDQPKIEKLSDHIGLVYSGMGPDFRLLVKKGRKIAMEYELAYGEEIPTVQLVTKLAAVMQEYTQSGGVRPFGVSLLVAGWDKEPGNGRPLLFQCDPSGAYFAWKATALGKNDVNAKTFLEKRFNEQLELEDGVHTALLTLRESFDVGMNEDNVEVAICNENGFQRLSKQKVKDYLGAL
ncbi:unnamed protein product, partial [Mesorhabditis belari]|uniref:Proteasome alpha-type subunits domain-containing protein n=1 Tax=Mesorhabditis belari TaxID=2138241 RepID=A0AAF3ESH1_9BILA